MKLTTLIIRNRKIDVEVDDSGNFTAEYKGQDLDAPTLEALKAKLDRAIKNDRIEPVHFIHWNGETLKRGTCTGLHAEHGHLLIKWEDERGGSQHYRLEGTIDPVHTAEYKKLCDAVLAAEKARDNFQKEHEFDLKAQIQEAVAANEKTAA